MRRRIIWPSRLPKPLPTLPDYPVPLTREGRVIGHAVVHPPGTAELFLNPGESLPEPERYPAIDFGDLGAK